MLAKYYKNTSQKNLQKIKHFLKRSPDLLDTVRQKISTLFKKISQLKKEDFKHLLSRDSLAEFYEFIYKINNKQKVIFSLVIILVAAVLSLIKYNQSTMQDGAVFRRSVLSAWDYTSDRNSAGMKTSLKKETTALAVLVERDNSQIEFQLPINNPSLEVKDNTATYINADKNIEVKYEFETNKLKESIILNSPTNNFEFTSSFLVQNLIVKMNDERIPVFFDTDNNYQFHFERPYAIDAAGQTTFALTYTLKPKTTTINTNPFNQKSQRPQNLLELETLQDIQVNTNEYELIVSVDPQWLLDPTRQYPIIIDPTIVHDTSAEFAVGNFNRVTDTGSGSTPVLESYYQELTANQNTVGLWHLNESAGSGVADSSGNGLNGTASGTTIVSGLFANARNFNGSSSYINLGVDHTVVPLFADNTQSWTVEAWYKNSGSTGTNQVIVGRGGGTGGSATFALFVNTSEGISTVLRGTNSTLQASGATDNEWHYVAVTWNGNQALGYFDGNQPVVLSVGAAAIQTNLLNIGATASGGSLFFGGSIDEVRISNVALTTEEIKAAAQRRPYAVYTSPVIDLGTNENAWSDFQKLSWTESGGQTGDGEIPSDTSGLVAQWDFNETSGNDFYNNFGSCGVSCNGTFSNFTISQDAYPNSGWTADRKWGNSALKFNGTSDYATVPDSNHLSFGNGSTDSPFSIGMWIKPSSIATATGDWLINKRNADVSDEYQMVLNTTGGISFVVMSGNSNFIGKIFNYGINTKEWSYVVATYDGSKTNDGIKLYLNGKLRTDATNNNLGTYTGMANGPHPVTIGKPGWSNSLYFDGVIDTTAIYSRVLTDSEILSNYNATNIQFQTRAGADSTPNDGSWEDWKPANESLLKDFEETYLYDQATDSLYAYWPMDETADNTCSGGQDICDKKSTKHLTVSGTGSKILNGKFNNGRSLPGGSATEYFSISGLSDFPTTAITTEFWIKTTDTTDGIISYDQGATANEWLIYDSSNLKIYRGSTGLVTTNISINDGLWHHVAVTWNSADGLVELYKDGTRVYYGSLGSGSSITSNGSLVIGQDQDGEMAGFDPAQAFGGEIDELKIYNTVLDADIIAKNYLQGSLNPDNLSNQISSNIKITGNQALKTEAGVLKADQYTMGLWHLNETGGSGAYLKDTSGYGNHATPVGTTPATGLASKARSFNGSSNYLTIPDSNSLDVGNNLTVSAWIKPTLLSSRMTIYSASDNNTANAFQLEVGPASGGSNTVAVLINGTWIAQAVNDVLVPGKWQHVAYTRNGTGATHAIYVNGTQVSLVTNAANNFVDNSVTKLIGGRTTASQLFNGLIDEVSISNTALSATKIAENYRLGRDHYLNYQLTASQDLSNKSTLPFYVAADRPGTYLAATIGESATANYQAGKNVAGIWHLDEESNVTSLPSAGGGVNNLVISGATTTEGIIGKARYFNGTNNFATVADNQNLRVNDYTVSVWIWPDGVPSETWKGIVGKPGRNFHIWLHSDGYIHHRFHNDVNTNSGAPNTPNGSINWNQWNHIVITNDGITAKTYINGILMAKGSAGGTPIADNNALQVGRNLDASAANYFKGIIDEIIILNKASTDEEVKQLFDINKRTHSVTIDFGAALDSGNLITGSGDTSFTVDATVYGLSNKGSNLYEGDKIIIRENYDGTEYIAQGTVDSVNASTGAVTVAAWDSGGTFPTGGFTANAEVFKWQREFFDLTGSKPEHRNTASLLTFRLTNGHEARTVWLDDIKAATDYLTTPLGSAITSTTGNRYVQYRTIFTATDTLISSTLSSVAIGGFAGSTSSTGNCYLEESPHDDQITLHWSDNATGELGFEIEKRINGTIWTLVDRTSANVNSYSDENISADNTYQYRVRSFADDGSTGEWCATAVVDLGTGSFQFEGLKMEGIRLD